ncbi:uncharacterized protein LOC107040378 [Diachasma alloeum]|uniref:uncharacterized protein LOC107040378 n=1 Tax=Diachasma alloeum TaxID=454923 RepID=UPI000738101F|nr:uncharacterized protein LOC107040378 [Diachasma alloeum]
MPSTSTKKSVNGGEKIQKEKISKLQSQQFHASANPKWDAIQVVESVNIDNPTTQCGEQKLPTTIPDPTSLEDHDRGRKQKKTKRSRSVTPVRKYLRAKMKHYTN